MGSEMGPRSSPGKTSYRLPIVTMNWIQQEAQLLLGDRATRKHAKNCRNGRGNDNLGWNDLQMYFKVIKSGTNRKLVYDFLLVVYGNFCRITHPTLIWRPLSSELPRISAAQRCQKCQKLCSLGYIFVTDSIWVALQIFEQFCPKRSQPISCRVRNRF